jgi:hypothetical protein
MSAQIKYLPEFLRRLQRERAKPMTWLIGAGVSASSGIPLARDISSRLIMFEYLVSEDYDASERLPRPWDDKNFTILGYDQNNIEDFFDWYEKCQRENDTKFFELMSEAIEWIKKRKGFENITPDNPECYQKMFKDFIQRSSTTHLVLTSLVQRGKGINLAHIGLAGLLKDFKDTWGIPSLLQILTICYYKQFLH